MKTKNLSKLVPWLLAALVTTPALAQEQNGTDEAAEQAADTDSAAPADTETLDIEALRREYARLRDELFRSRARAATVASALYSTKLQVHLRHESGRFHTINRATIRLDGANIYDDTGGAIAADVAPRFEGFVAPGRHVLGVRIEATAKDDERFTSVVETQVVIQAPNDSDVVVTARAKDDGDMSYAWQKKQKGSYQLRLDILVEAQKRPETKSAGKAAGHKTGKRAGPAHAAR